MKRVSRGPRPVDSRRRSPADQSIFGGPFRDIRFFFLKRRETSLLSFCNDWVDWMKGNPGIQ